MEARLRPHPTVPTIVTHTLSSLAFVPPLTTGVLVETMPRPALTVYLQLRPTLDFTVPFILYQRAPESGVLRFVLPCCATHILGSTA